MTTMTEDEILTDLANDPHDFSHARVVANYKGPKISAVITGCGAWLTSLISAPGASRVVDEIQVLYSEEAMFRFLKANLDPDTYIQAEMAPAVSPERARFMIRALGNATAGRDVQRVAVTGAITSARYRRGSNRAWIAVGKDGLWQLQLDKLEEHEHTAPNVFRNRLAQDRMISEVALSLATDVHSKLCAELIEGGYLVHH
jgi:nicotinamide mononucleotide (NMN) deamidase PncC